MKSNARKRTLTVGAVVALAAVVSLTSTGELLAQQSKSVMALIVNNTDAPVPVRDMDNAARQPWAETAVIPIPASDEDAAVAIATPVPTDKQLVIESYSGAVCSTAPGSYLEGVLAVTTNGVPRLYRLKFDGLNYVLPNGAGSYTRWTGIGTVRFYADPGSTIAAGIKRSENFDAIPITCQITLSGHLEDLP